ncbi:amino acid synthesis family protein (plasmid) [Rhizobium phaseoli]|uniref:amino acid synthesis family protein n=1 Tax=Rhizobium phaseoli TaxID=396 RepID=UPI0007EBF38A|nr:amino acid synthesis family protein [Rhizobium phaseoli]ANL51061.1 amino acid synthesis family protein [Rhizobium phaseoli]
MELIIRKRHAIFEETLRDMGRAVDGTRIKLAVALVIENPYAGKFVDDLSDLVALGEPLGRGLIDYAAELLPATLSDVTAYGKAAVVGSEGELEHAAALMHPKFGGPIRARLGKGPAIIPGTKKMGVSGQAVTMPLTNCNDIWQFDEMDSMEVYVPDAPRPNEILMVLGLAMGGRPLKRI